MAIVSILALAQRASLYRIEGKSIFLLFQFSPSHRGHRISSCLMHRQHGVSILALAQRASQVGQGL